jgi:HAD superfamily hydrolase (TIGR01662 family)
MGTLCRSKQGVRVKTVIFDLGETLVDETRQFEVVAEAAGVPLFTLAGVIGSAIERGLDHWAAYDELGISPGSAVDHGYVVDTRVFYDDAIPTLRELKALGYRVGIVANQPAGIAEQLTAMDLELDVIATSVTYGVAKPDPRFFERIVADCDVPASEIVYVGDRLDNDVLPAQSVGMHTVFIRRGPWGYVHARWPEMAQVRYRIDSLAELSGVLEIIGREG